MTSRYELAPGLFATGVASLPIAASVALKKPIPGLYLGVGLGIIDYMFDRATFDFHVGNYTG